MKIAPARLAAFLQRPDPAIRAVLLYGPDSGLVRERADTLVRTVCPDLRDPFRIADLNAGVLGADPARLADEAAQLSLAGGRRVVRVRDAADGLARLFAGFLGDLPGEALVVAEAGELSAGSALRRAFEGSPRAAAIGCYPDAPRDRAAVIRDSLAAHRVTASRDAAQYLVEHLGGDRLLTRSELEKLALYAGEGGRVELEDALLSVGDSAALELDDAVMAAAEGDTARLERVLGRVFQEGELPVSVIRRGAAPSSSAARARRAGIGRDAGRRGAAQCPSADFLQARGQLQTAARGFGARRGCDPNSTASRRPKST